MIAGAGIDGGYIETTIIVPPTPLRCNFALSINGFMSATDGVILIVGLTK
jgi:hypothetical protein